MELLPLTFASGWACGLNAYATVLVLGLLGRFAHLAQVPDGLQRTDVLLAAGVLAVLERAQLETQLAQAVTIQRSSQAAAAVKQATDLTNDLLTSNAKNLREANARIRTEMERGVFDIESVRTANAELIATMCMPRCDRGRW